MKTKRDKWGPDDAEWSDLTPEQRAFRKATLESLPGWDEFVKQADDEPDPPVRNKTTTTILPNPPTIASEMFDVISEAWRDDSREEFQQVVRDYMDAALARYIMENHDYSGFVVLAEALTTLLTILQVEMHEEMSIHLAPRPE
jgi:hypothetical protein